MTPLTAHDPHISAQHNKDREVMTSLAVTLALPTRK